MGSSDIPQALVGMEYAVGDQVSQGKLYWPQAILFFI